MGVDRAAAARTTVADGVEAIQHGILEKCVVYVALFMLCLQEFDAFFPCNPPCPSWVVFNDKADKGLTDDQTNVERQTGVCPYRPAGTINNCKVIGVLQNDIPRPAIGNNFFQIGEPDIFIYGDQLRRRIKRYDLSVIAFGKSFLAVQFGQERIGQPAQERAEDAVQRVIPRTDADVEIGPPSVHIPMQPVHQFVSPGAAGLPYE